MVVTFHCFDHISTTHSLSSDATVECKSSCTSYLAACAVQGFIRQPSRDIVLQSRDPKELIDRLENYSPPASIIKLALEGKLLHNLRG